MNWKDPNGPWARAMRLRMRRPLVIIILWLAAPLAIGAFVLLGGFLPVSAVWIGGWPLALLALLWLVGPLVGVRTIRIEQEIARLVPLHEGLICPACRTPVANLPAEGACPKCHRAYTHEQVREYWDQYPRSGIGTGMTPERHMRLERASYWPVFWWAVAVVVGLAALALLGQGRVALFVFLPAIASLGSALLDIASLRPQGSARHCAACGYQQAPQGETALLCPECGAVWSAPGGTVRGRRARKPCIIWTSRGLWAFTIAWCLLLLHPVVRGLFFPMPVLPVVTSLPTSFPASLPTWTSNVLPNVLIDTDEWWNLLNSRTLTAAEEVKVAEELLDKRRKTQLLSSNAGTWLKKRLSEHTLPAEIVERFYREMREIWIEAPDNAKVAVPFQVSLASKQYAPYCGGGGRLIYVAGFFVDDSPEPLARTKRSIPLLQLNGEQYKPAAELMADDPGLLRIRLVVWFVAGVEVIKVHDVEWQADGTPVIPPEAQWSERIEVERTVLVEE